MVGIVENSFTEWRGHDGERSVGDDRRTLCLITDLGAKFLERKKKQRKIVSVWVCVPVFVWSKERESE